MYPLISTSIERQLLKEPIRIILKYVNKVSKEIFNEIGENEEVLYCDDLSYVSFAWVFSYVSFVLNNGSMF